MIKIENAQVVGFEPAIRGMRNPHNSWEMSDTVFLSRHYCDTEEELRIAEMCGNYPHIGQNDLKLMKNLAKAGKDHRKYMRMIVVYADITAPMYWWKEMDTYKVGTVRNSTSTMHRIYTKEFTLNDFSCERMSGEGVELLQKIIDTLNEDRKWFNTGRIDNKKDYWYEMIQLLPSSYNQKSTMMFNYEVLANIYHSRKDHKLDEWIKFCKWIESLPYSEIITNKE